MYLITSILNLIIQILLIVYQLLTSVLGFNIDDAVKNQCVDSWHFKDSNVSALLNCFMISMPIQQFTSCFYIIPMEHKFFDQTEDIMGAGDLDDEIKEGMKELADGIEEVIDDIEGKDAKETEMKKIKGDDDDVEQLDKDEPKGDDENQAAAPPTPEIVMKDVSPAAPQMNGKEEVTVIPKPSAQHTEQLGTDASHSEIIHTEQSEKKVPKATKDLRSGV
jgi:hypothetical protein